MSNSYSNYEDIYIRLKDGDTPAHQIDIRNVEPGGELPRGVWGKTERRVVYDGNIVHNYKKDRQTLDEVLFSFTGEVFTEDILGTGAVARHVIEQWFNMDNGKGYGWDGTSAFEALVTTNPGDGSAVLIDGDDFVFEMQYLMDNSITDKAIGWLFPYVEQRDFKFINDEDTKFMAEVRIVSHITEVEDIQALA